MKNINWDQLYAYFKVDLKLWIYFMAFQQCARLVFIACLSNYLAPATDATAIINAMLNGLRFDSLWATVWIMLAIPVFRWARFRFYLGLAFTITTSFIYASSIEYYREYKELFNQFLFNFFYDDKVAILQTIAAEHNVVVIAISIFSISLLYAKVLAKIILKPIPVVNYSQPAKVLTTCLILLFYVIGFRGSIGPRPIQLKDAAITSDPFLNKAVVSPYSAMKYAIKQHRQTNQSNPFASSAAEAKATAKSFFATTAEHQQLSSYMEKTTAGSKLAKPQHVFLIIGESLDAWPLLPEYAEFNLTPNLKHLANQGIHFQRFLPCAHGTMDTLNSILSGLMAGGLYTNYQKSSYSPYPTALAKQVKKLGFKPQFFYGGYLSWQRLEDFAYAQGFEKVYGASHMSSWQQTNEWGVDDHSLFKFIQQQVNDTEQPTFNVIMTTSNHPPYSVALAKEGFDLQGTQQLLTKYKKSEANVKELGHIWYADKAIGKFVANMESQYPTALFAITGDHFGRRHVLPSPPLFDTSAVPLIFYGNKIHQHYTTNGVAGSHLDLNATLIELLAPTGFKYKSIGNNLFAKVKSESLGIGLSELITPEFIAQIDDNQAAALRHQHTQAMQLSWWLIKKQDQL